MAEAALHSCISEDDNNESNDMNEVSNMAARTRSTTTSSSSSKKSSSKRSKKKDDLEVLEQKFEQRLSNFDTRLDKIFEFMTTKFQNPVTTGEQVIPSVQQDSGSSGVRRPLVQMPTMDNLPIDNEIEGNGQADQDVMSLAPGRSERQDIGLYSDDDMSCSVRSDTENNQRNSRFSKYLSKCTQDSENKDTTDTNDNLKLLFGDDAKTKSVKNSIGLVLDKSQIEVLSGSWHCKNPEKITAYNEEYKACFPIHDSAEEHLNVPSLDSFTADLLVKKHGSKAFAVASKKKTLFSPFLKSVEKLAFQGQAASKMGITATAYIQQALGSLYETLSDKEVNLDRAVQQVKDIFAMSTKAVDQVARTGAFHHLIRRKAVMEDTGLNDIKELKNPLLSLPLSSGGVFGEKFEQTLKDRIEKDKQLKELLPELNLEKTFPVKRKNTNSNDWTAKRPKVNTNANNSKPGQNRSMQRTSTVSKPEKNDTKTEKNNSNFRPSYNQGKFQQKK